MSRILLPEAAFFQNRSAEAGKCSDTPRSSGRKSGPIRREDGKDWVPAFAAG